MTKEEFESNYDYNVIPQGVFMQYGLNKQIKLGHSLDAAKMDTSHDMSIVNGDEVHKFGHFQHAHYAGYVEDLLNAYRNGDLVWKEATNNGNT